METINFVNDLKHTLWNIETVGGNPTIYVTPNHELLKKLRSLIFETVKNQNIAQDDENWRRSSFFEDVLSTDRFEKRIRYCIIKLREFGIPDVDYFAYISQALSLVIEKESRRQKSRQSNTTTLETLLVAELARCFEIWYYPSEVQYYEIVAEHQLADFDYTLQKWRLTSVGRYVINLPSFEMIVFLCALEVILGRKGANSRYMNAETLNRLLEMKPVESIPRRHYYERLPISLRWFGIMDAVSEKPVITDFGRKVLVKVSSNLESLRDTILLLTESELGGVRFSENQDLINQIRERTRQSQNIADDQKNSIESAVNLFTSGHYLDSLRLFYPNIEAVLNNALIKMKLRPNDFKGMKEKVQRLEKEQALSTRLGTWAEVVASRNKVVHGNLVEEDAELVKPLFYFIGTFWTLLIEELDNRLAENISLP